MTKKEIIAYLRLCADDDVGCHACTRFEKYKYGGTAECNEKLMLEAADALEESLREQEERRWIPVTERFPEEEGWYLVYTTPNREHKSINKAMFCKGYAWGNFEPYWRGAGGHWANVTHWMPLPEPPKGE